MDTFKPIYEQVIKDLENELPNWLTYHNADHTKYVIEQAEHIARQEKIAGNDLFLIKIAALYHDTGFLIRREDHEALSCDYASSHLEGLLSKKEIDLVCGMIKATKIPQQPKTLSEKIIADADLEYLGTENFLNFSKNLYHELLHFNKEFTPDEWDETQIGFLTAHSYHTDYCKKYKEPIKLKNLQKVQKRLAGKTI